MLNKLCFSGLEGIPFILNQNIVMGNKSILMVCILLHNTK